MLTSFILTYYTSIRVGLLFNEIIMSPNVILTSIQTMLERVIDMDTGKYRRVNLYIYISNQDINNI